MHWLGRRQKPININDLANRHMVAALAAHYVEQEERHSGKVVSRHLPGIVRRHLTIVNVLDRMLEAAEKEKEG